MITPAEAATNIAAAVGPAGTIPAPPVVFDFSINLTTIIGVVIWIITLAVAWTKFGGRMDMIELRVTNIEKALESIAETLKLYRLNESALAVLTVQLTSIQKEQVTLHETVEMLRRGDGWVTGQRRANLDGEYSRSG